jgi:3'(2'), 5'-bisphosphate nucleotidase
MTKISDNLISRLAQALRAAVNAGEAILNVYDSSFAVELKDDRSPLTAADRRSHKIIVERLNEIPILSEEGKDVPFELRKNWEFFWLVDPLDGTKEFVKRNGEFTVNIALIRRDSPVMGVIFVPVRGLLYFAAEGLGSFRLDLAGWGQDFDSTAHNQESADVDWFSRVVGHSTRLEITKKTSPGGSLTIAGSRSHATRELEEFTEKMKGSYAEIRFIPAGSSLKFCMVSEGNADIYPRFGPTMEWDTAAGHCIVNESGGEVISAASGTSLVYNKPDLRNPSFICRRKD